MHLSHCRVMFVSRSRRSADREDWLEARPEGSVAENCHSISNLSNLLWWCPGGQQLVSYRNEHHLLSDHLSAYIHTGVARTKQTEKTVPIYLFRLVCLVSILALVTPLFVVMKRQSLKSSRTVLDIATLSSSDDGWRFQRQRAASYLTETHFIGSTSD